ncbi:histidine kinase [Mucilaginibacter sp. SMC90]|uniref:histidine kinase n=1 Tax=Mucilaginibacter sp. SMC90 TaxID=2929803 RepID=UPI001FB3A42E|nr:sensor histidine kinase [Mucilaginibacter sp. SMC90]UOE51339.1 histidine kinase [Mucilaginibacter sp. SMC90]
MNDIKMEPFKIYKFPEVAKHLLILLWIIGLQILLMICDHIHPSFRGDLHFLLQIIAYFILYYWAVPPFFSRKTTKKGVLRLIILILLYGSIRSLNSFHGGSAIEFLYFIVSFNQAMYSLANLTLLIGLNFLLGLFRYNEQLKQNYIEALEGKILAETEKSKIESIVTQMRLSPHLLFNTLNYIKEKADGVIPEIVLAVGLFSGIIRHAMTDILRTQTVLLSEEIEKIKNQIELHYLLANRNVFIDFKEELDDSIEGATIPPSTLLTFIENIFRYGIVKDPDFRPCISVHMAMRQFTFSTFNYKRLNPHPGTGMGIRSVGSTLGYYFPASHELHIEDTKETFRLTLKIQM